MEQGTLESVNQAQKATFLTHNGIYTPAVIYPQVPQESEQLMKMRHRKKKKQEQKAKNIKQEFVLDGEKDKYNIDNVLQELGEVGDKTIFFGPALTEILAYFVD